MHKKLITACVSLVALAALALPALASATPVLTTSAGATVTTGTAIKATSSSSILTTTSGNITCTNNSMSGTLIANTGTTILGTISAASFKGDDAVEEKCTSTVSDGFGGKATFKVTPENLPWCIHDEGGGNIATIYSEVGGVCTGTKGALKFTFDITTQGGANLGSCTFEKATPVEAEFVTNVSPLNLTTKSNSTFTKTSGIFCPSSGTLDATFKVQTSAGGELKIS